MIEAEEDSYYNGSSDDVDESIGAPIFEVPRRKIVAIEHPCVLLNLDKGLATFGQDPGFQKLLANTPKPSSVPLWFRPDNPTSKPITSHHTATNNILLKITVPKRTGRKRKRGTNQPFTGDVGISDREFVASEADQISSVSRCDTPKSVLRKIQDNIDDYQVEVVGNVRDTHRYRGMADFQFANIPNSFLTKTAEHLLPMKVSKLREIKFTPGVVTGPGLEIIPPPHFTDRLVGFNYNYEQNPNTKIEEDGLFNIQGRKKNSYGYFINHNTYPVPDRPRREPNMPMPDGLMNQLNKLMEERPLWTRRAILNRIIGDYSDTLLKAALQVFAYQFRGGPWRDAFVRYGVDPREDPKFRHYQTLAFKLEKNIIGTKKVPWEVIRKSQMKRLTRENRDSHIWDGEYYSTDGKLWQVCDITDPFIRKLIDQAPLRAECDVNDSGWYYKGTWTKIKIAMKVKMIAIEKGRMGSDNDSPQKPGFLYNSFLEERLRQWPDKVDKPLGLTLEPFLRPIQEVDTRLRKRRPNLPAKKKAEAAAADTTTNDPSSHGGEEPDSLNPDGVTGNDEDMLDEMDDDVLGDGEEVDLAEDAWDVDPDEDIDDTDEDIDDDMEEYSGYSDNDEGDGEEYGEGEDENIDQEYDHVAMDDNHINDTYE